MHKRWPTTLWGIDNLQPYDIFCKRVGACVDACALIVYLPHGYWEKWSCYGICMLHNLVTREELVRYALGTVLSLYLSYRGGAIRKLVQEYAKFWPKSPMYHHSTTLKLVISGHRYHSSFQCFIYFHSLFFLLHFLIVYLFPGWNLMFGVKEDLRRPVVSDWRFNILSGCHLQSQVTVWNSNEWSYALVCIVIGSW